MSVHVKKLPLFQVYLQKITKFQVSEKTNLKFEWVSLQPEWFIFTAEKLAAIPCKLLHQTTKHYVQLLGAELLNKTLLFTLLFILFSLQDRKAKQLLC